jgi:hypothetical protein
MPIPEGQRCWRLIVKKVKGAAASALSLFSSGPAADEDLCLLCGDEMRRSLTVLENSTGGVP